MKKVINSYMRKTISNWDNTYTNGILVYDWPLVSEKLKDVMFDFELPEDLRIAILALNPNDYIDTIHYKGLTDFLGDSSIYELLTGTSQYDYSIEEGIDLVKWYLLNYWSFKYR